jgi:predicted phage terminase large subunit-like protein
VARPGDQSRRAVLSSIPLAKHVTSIGWSDPRTTPGQLLWPERFGPPEIDELKKALGPYGSAGQLQQRPSPSTGGVFQRGWWKYWQPAGANLGPIPVKQADGSIRMVEAIPLPPLEEELHSWDMAYRDLKESDFVVGQHWGRAAARKFLLHQIKGRWDFARTANEFKRFAEDYPVPAKLVENAANGPGIIWALEATVPGIIAVPPIGSKEARAAAVSPQVEAGNVYLPHPAFAEWVAAFIDEAATFPRGAHDDQVDACSQALNRLNRADVMRMYPEFRAHRRDGEPPEACHVIAAAPLDGWWQRFAAVSSTRGPASIVWLCQVPSGQLVAYREWQGEASGDELGARLAESSLAELENTRTLTVFLAPEHFDTSAAAKSLAREIQKGIEAVTGPESSFAYQHTEDERRMDREQAWLALDMRRRKAEKARLLLRAADGDRAGGWEFLRGLLRWWPIHQVESIPYDREIARRLAEGPDGQERLDEYMRQVAGDPISEILPGFLISEDCPHLITSLSALVRDEKKMDATAPWPAAEALLAGMMGYRENTHLRPPLEAYTAQRLEELKKRSPHADAQQIHMAATKAEVDWKKKFGQRAGWNFSRLGRK